MERFETSYSKRFKIILIYVAMIIQIESQLDYLHQNYPETVIEDAMLETPDLLKKYNFPSETHNVITEDGYVLCMHRIPNSGGRPILLIHGLFDSSATWILMGPWNGLGYYLHENGFDVWMGNVRGNRYSRNHTYENPSFSSKYWDFSWHEIGFYDLPAMIDYILQETSHKKLTFVGHSQGTTSYFVMCSTRPDYNSKIVSMHAIAPVAFMKNAKIPFFSLQQTLLNVLRNATIDLTLPRGFFLDICFGFDEMLFELCIESIYHLIGRETKEMNATMWPVVIGHCHAGGSLKQIKHFIQLKSSGRFCHFDYGEDGNRIHYGTSTPPDYALRKVSSPVALYYVRNDHLCSITDVQNLARMLPNIIENRLYPYKNWNHLTAMWGKRSRAIVHKRILDVIKQSYKIKTDHNEL